MSYFAETMANYSVNKRCGRKPKDNTLLKRILSDYLSKKSWKFIVIAELTRELQRQGMQCSTTYVRKELNRLEDGKEIVSRIITIGDVPNPHGLREYKLLSLKGD
jgi:hypothetical protein